jgi:hypothetical protein
MTKYNIEGGIDFYAELYKSLDVEEDFEEDNNVCLITNQPLIDKHVIMVCGHKFNYIPLYYDITNHKQKFNGLESSNGKLNMHQIRCPYCRKKQDTLLPYYEEFGLAKVNGVNFYDPNIKHATYNSSYNHQKCAFKYPNENYDPTKPETDSNSKYLTTKCCHYGSQIQLYNYLNESQPITYGDNNFYCYTHKKMMIKQYKAEEKQKAKDEAKATKQKAKEDAKAAKELEKQKAKEEKQKAKDDAKAGKEAAKLVKKKQTTENVVIGPSNVVVESPTINGCSAILKSGLNKGKPCGCAIKLENKCFRHIKLLNN